MTMLYSTDYIIIRIVITQQIPARYYMDTNYCLMSCDLWVYVITNNKTKKSVCVCVCMYVGNFRAG